jgi:phosphatidylserine/phosphatidylglycerophosphate/cardiolipin synthase-like enzyme
MFNLVNMLNSVLGIKAIRRNENMTCQILRSATHWSIGSEKNEYSIVKAYCDLIDESKHYIVIQNQYFISRSYTEDEANAKGIKKSSSEKIRNL